MTLISTVIIAVMSAKMEQARAIWARDEFMPLWLGEKDVECLVSRAVPPAANGAARQTGPQA